MTRPSYAHNLWVYHLRLVVLGALTGVLAVAFRESLETASSFRHELLRVSGEGMLGLAVSVLFSLGTILVAVWVVNQGCPEAAGSGIPQVKVLAKHPHPIRWARLLLIKFSSGVLGIGGGLALGREGPTVQMGAALGELLGMPRWTSAGEKRQMLILGSAAGLAGAFNAPLAGALFVFEELGEEFNAHTCLAALLVTFSADTVCRALTGQAPQLGMYPHAAPALALLPCFLFVGWLGGVAGVIFNQTLLALLRKRQQWPRWVLPLAVGTLIGVLGWLHPSWVGGGDRILERFHREQLEVFLTLTLLLTRFGLTVLSYSTGAAGGLFAPLLVLGALMGNLAGCGCASEQRLAFVIVGMAALFTGTVRAPLTGVLLLIEMAGAHALLLPLLGASLTAKLTADGLGDKPIYEALVESNAARQESLR